MKRRINDLLSGKFTYKPYGFGLSEEQINEEIISERCRGRFTVEAREGRSLQGFLYSTNPRVTFSPNMFFSGKETITYETDAAGLQAGDVITGAFVLCTSEGEKRLPYSFSVPSSKGDEVKEERVLTPQEFAAMAKENYGEAYMRFVSPAFAQIAAGWGEQYAALYENLREAAVSYHTMEQFLVGAGLKEPVRFTFSQSEMILEGAQADFKEELLLHKSGWGFASLKVVTDQVPGTSSFLQIERDTFTTDEFVGSVYHIGFVVRKALLHQGRNYARIEVMDGCHASVAPACTVEVRCAQMTDKLLHRQKQEITRLMSAYIDYRAGRCEKAQWLSLSLRDLENYHKYGGDHIFYQLYEAYLCCEKNDDVSASVIMTQVQERKKELEDASWKGFYLYLTTRLNHDKEYLEQAREALRTLYLENQENWILQWLMFRVNSHLIRNASEKLNLIRRQYLCGCHSPIMYLEAYDIIREEPLMLHELDVFEIHLMRFLCREHLLNREICGQIAQLACRIHYFDPIVFEILDRCFEVYPSRNLLTAICGMLIKGRKKDRIYAKWYELGIRQDIRITGMYEYYIETMEELHDKLLPQSVRMYFAYNNTLDYTRKAAIYANVLRNQERDPQTLENYLPSIQIFMEDQLKIGRVNEDLAVLYESLLTKEMLDADLVRGLTEAVFTCEIVCENPLMRNVVVTHPQFEAEQKTALRNGRAYVRIYSSNAIITLEDECQARYADPTLYSIKRLLQKPELLQYCRELLPLSPGLIVADCLGENCDNGGCQAPESGETDRISRLTALLAMEGVRESCKERVQEMLLQYFSKNPNHEALYPFLAGARHLSNPSFFRRHRDVLVKLYLEEGLAEEAYDLIRNAGMEKIEPRMLVRICSYMVEKRDYEEDPVLLAMCFEAFSRGVYDEKQLKYLLRFYEGPVEDMKKLWKAGQGFELDSYSFEEHILTSVLFMGEHFEDTEDIFASYRRKDGKAILCRAYVALLSYQYFVKLYPAKQPVFTYIEQEMLGSLNTPEVCRLALLKYFTKCRELTAGQQQIMVRLLNRADEMGLQFAFFRDLPGKLQRALGLRDKVFLECRTDPQNSVTLHYSLNDQKEQILQMTDMFEGIFVQEFPMFYLDRLTWHCTIEEKGHKYLTEQQMITNNQRSVRGSTTRYDLINAMIEALHKQDEAAFAELKQQYLAQQYLAEQLF